MSTASPRPVFAALHTVKASEVTQWSSRESKATFKRYLQIQLFNRSEKQSIVECVSWTLYACVYVRVACVYNYVHELRTLRDPRSTSCDDNVKFSAPFGLSTCCIVILSNHHRSLIIVLHYCTLLYTTAHNSCRGFSTLVLFILHSLLGVHLISA